MQPGAPILIVSHTFPPFRGIGGRRWAKLAKELARRGHPVHVVHADHGSELTGSLWDADARHPLIHRHPLPLRYPKVLMKRPLNTMAEKIGYRIWLKLLPLLAKGNVFDRSVRWGAVLLSACTTLIEQHGIRHVIATAPPFALLHQLLALKRDHNIMLVADLRDPWTWGEVYGRTSMTPAQKAAEDRLEAEVVSGYDAVITPSPFILEHLRGAYPEHSGKFSVLDHIIDPDELGQPTKRQPDEDLRIIYAGSVYNGPGFTAYFAEVLKAFGAVQRETPERWAHLAFDLFITGHGTDAWERMAKEAGQQERIRFHQPLPGPKLFPMIAKADFVLAYMPPEKRDFVSTKFNEIAYLGTPILHVGEPGGLSQHIVQQQLGATLLVSDIADGLVPLLKGTRRVLHGGTFNPQPYLLSGIAGKLLNTILKEPT
ncbi:MAG: glycosyltransferase [Flavobacteriales bacterium]